MKYFNSYPRKIRIGVLSDGTPIYETVSNDEEYENLLATMEAEQDRVRAYFEQYP